MTHVLRLWRLWLAAVLLCSAWAGSSQAQEKSDPALQEAKAAFEEAQLLYTKGQYEESAAKFLVAYDKKTFSSFLFNAAVAYEKGRQLDKAIAMFQRYLAVDPQARDAVEVMARIDGLQAAMAPVPGAEPKPGEEPAQAPVAPQVLPAIDTKGLVIIESKPQGANIYLDDPAKGVFATTPWQGSLSPRPIRVILEAKGFKREIRDISPRSDKILEVYIALSEEHFLGWIEVISNVPGAEVYIDREDIGAIGRTPYTGHVQPGKHTVWVKRAGFQASRKEIDVQPGTATTHQMNLDVVGTATLRAGGRGADGGKLFVDGALACTLPCEQSLSPGSHALKVEREGMEDYVGSVSVNRADVALVDVSYSPKPSRVKAWTDAVFSAAFFAGGIYLGLKGNQIKDDIDRDVGDLGKLVNTDDSRKSDGKLYYIGADICFGLGVVTAALAVWNFLESGPPSTATVRTTNLAQPAPQGGRLGLVPSYVPGGAGLAATGRF